MSIRALFAFFFGICVFISVNVFAQSSSQTDGEGSIKIKEFLKEFKVKITKKELLTVIETLNQAGKISKEDAEKAKKEVSSMSDNQFSSLTEKVVDSIPDNMTVDQAKKKLESGGHTKKKP